MTYLTYSGKMSTFGGPDDRGVDPDEGLALIEWNDLHDPWFEYLFHQYRTLTEGLARSLNPDEHYFAMRWNYVKTSRAALRNSVARLSANGKAVLARPVDWGPNVDTGRIADLSPGAAAFLGLKTDDIVTIDLFIP